MMEECALPENMTRYSEEERTTILQYLHQLNDNQKKAYSIAKNHLGTSFNLVRSTGYVEWKKKRERPT